RVEPSPYPVEEITLPTDRYVNPSPVDRTRAAKERQEMARVFARRTPARFSLPLSRPLAESPPGRNFGRKRVFNGEARQPHLGVDYPVPDGTDVLAADDGVVALSAQHFFPGRVVVIDHGGGLFSMYFHLSKSLVEAGAVVHRGEKIAVSGATGRVNGAHLHFGIHWQEARVNPELLFRPPADLPAVGVAEHATP
ncbi:MAG TPA: M23 family metallopeptidase, partial [Thermoanaerobaculia bacterium]|nr:M23 family metallopeptidase [Thermoanaerobaculia bacterium]